MNLKVVVKSLFETRPEPVMKQGGAITLAVAMMLAYPLGASIAKYGYIDYFWPITGAYALIALGFVVLFNR